VSMSVYPTFKVRVEVLIFLLMIRVKCCTLGFYALSKSSLNVSTLSII
jgi:hypothetical protein